MEWRPSTISSFEAVSAWIRLYHFYMLRPPSLDPSNNPDARRVDSEPSLAAAGEPHGTFAALSVPYYPRLWAGGLLWNLTRWMGIFLASYLINDLTGSPFLVQVVGTSFFAPMFFGGALGGVIADRFDRRRVLLAQLIVLAPVAAVMAAVVYAGAIEVWMVYPFMLAMGVGGVVDMTARRAMVYDFVGPRLVTNALALETLAGLSGGLTGNLTGGIVISAFGIAPCFLLISGFYAVSFLVLLGVPVGERARSPGSKPSLAGELRAGFDYVRRDRRLVSILGVTIVMNLTFFSFLTMVPVFADRLEVNALWTGVLAASYSLGSLAGTLAIARGLPLGRGQVYVYGSLLGLVALFFFAVSPWYATSLLALLVSGAGIAGFATMQSVLVMVSAEEEMRGRALGLLSMAIGALPFAMLGLGVAAQLAGPVAAVAGSVSIGLVAVLLFCRRWPEAVRAA